MEKIGKKIGKELSQHELLSSSLNAVFHNGYSTALWRNPNSDTKHQAIDLSNEVEILTDQRLEEMGQAFIFCSFSGQQKYAIRNHIHIKLEKEASSATTHGQEYSSEQFFSDFQQGPDKNKELNYYINTEANPNSTDYEHYIRYIEKGMKMIEDHHFQKFVPARTKPVMIDSETDIVTLFLDLCDQYPNAFVSLVSIPGIGTWIGASPETLISVDKEGTFNTVSLAGTQPFRAGTELYDMPWTQKEIEEQAMVTRYVIDCFKKIRLREFEEYGPKTVKAGNLCHLKTDFFVNTKETNFKDLGSVMLELLHPTSAVCGMPMQASMEFIKANEGFEREFFSGYMGPVNIEEEIRIFVNLRCMQLLVGQAILYAGAGVTAYSVPDSEWKETELKCKTMESIFSIRG